MSAAPTPATPRGEGQMSLANRAVAFSLREAGVGLALVVLVVLFMIFAPYFATADNFTRMFGQVAINTVLAVGMTFVILIGGIDLSVGSVLALATVVGATIMVPDFLVQWVPFELDQLVSIPLAIVVILLVGAFCGGTRVLAAADVIQGVMVTGHPLYQQEYINAGGIPVGMGTATAPVLDGNILTCRRGQYYAYQVCDVAAEYLHVVGASDGNH